MTVAVLVPWSPDHAERSRNWAWLKRQWETTYGWDIIEGHPPKGPWNKSLAVADALTKTDADTLVIADADIWCPDVHLAVKSVERCATWAIPHRKVYRLNEATTSQLVQGRITWQTLGHPALDQTPYTGIAGGGIIAIKRDAYEQAPFDPRFNGWGGEDSAAGITWTALFGPPRRGTCHLWHLWHKPQHRLTRVKGSLESDALLRRYKTLQHYPQPLRDLIAEHTL